VRTRELLLKVFLAGLLCTTVTQSSVDCKELEVSIYRGSTLFGENRTVTLDKRYWTSRTGYNWWGVQARREVRWLGLFGFARYSYSPETGKREEGPVRTLRLVSSAHVASIGIGRHLGIGVARLGLTTGYARVHDSFTMIKFEETERESEVELSTSRSGLVLGSDLLLPVFESLGVSLSYNYLYRSRIRVGSALPLPDF
jgi:hypothetical protein